MIATKIKRAANIKIVQPMRGDFEYFTWSEKINRSYARRHGYDYVIRRDPARTDRHINWQKIPDMIAELHDCDYLLMLDADAFFYAQELKIEEELIPLMRGKPILMSQDVGSETERWTPGFPCAGAILLKTTGNVKGFLEDWDRSSETDDEYCWTWPLEQLPLWNHLLVRYKKKIQVELDYFRFHARFGHYIRHCMIQDDEQRTNIMKHYCETYPNNIVTHNTID